MKKIAIVDDIEALVEGYASSIEKSKLPYQVVGKFVSITEAYKFIKKNDIDLLVTDVRFPNSSISDLISFIKQVKKKQPSCKILAVSDLADASDKSRVMLGGADDVIEKDLNANFIQAIKDVFDGKTAYQRLETKQKIKLPYLNERELEIIDKLHLKNYEIAEQIHLSVKGTEDRIAKLLVRFEMNRTELYAWWQLNKHWYLDK
jgi:two-component system response regulator YesN